MNTGPALPAYLAAASLAAPADPSMPDGLLPRFILDPYGFMLNLFHGVLGFLGAAAMIILPIIGIALATLVVGRLIARRGPSRRSAGGTTFISILPPPDVATPHGAESLWRILDGELRTDGLRALIFGRPHVSFEMFWSAAGIRFGVWLPPGVSPTRVEAAIQAAWPGAATTASEPTPPLPPGAAVVGGELRLAQPEWFPLKTDHPVDPYRMLMGEASTLEPDCVASLQILARPAAVRRLVRCHRVVRGLRTGQSTNLVGKVLDLIEPGSPSKPTTLADDPWREQDIRHIQSKAQGPAWEVIIRYGVAGEHGDRLGRKLLHSNARALTSSFSLYQGRNHLSARRISRPGTTFASRRMRKGDLMSVPELVALAHLPLDVGVAGLVRAGARSVAPPVQIPSHGKILGDSETGPARPVAVEPADARHHLHVLGATGTGKSTLLTNLVIGDVEAGRGAVVIDPKGDLINDILERLPAGAAGRAVLMDPEEVEAPPAMNLLDGPDPQLAVEHLVGIFRRIFSSYWGPRTDDVLRVACLTVLRRAGATLTDVPRLLNDRSYRAGLVAQLNDPMLVDFWDWYDSLTPAGQSQVVGPIMNKLRVVLTRSFVSDVIGSSRSSFDMATDVLDGGLLLVRVPKGILGDDAAKLLGSFIVAKVWQAITARSTAEQGRRADASLYVDECQNFLNLPRSFEEMLAEARGYRLSVVCAHQYLTQLPPELKDAISTNARNKVFFNISPEDARRVRRDFAPELTEHDLCHLGGYQAAARLVVQGKDTPAFTLKTRPMPAAVPGRAEQIRAAARMRFGRSKDQRTDEALRRKLSGRRTGSVPGGRCAGRSAGSSGGVPDLPGVDGDFSAESGSINPAGGYSDSWMDS